MRAPAYSQRVLALRKNSEPDQLMVFYGRGWPRLNATHAMVGVADDWVPWSLDWSVAAGLSVLIHETGEAPPMIEGWPAVLWLAAEIQARALSVMIRDGDRWSSIMMVALSWTEELGESPPWWPGSIASVASQRWRRYMTAPEFRARAWWLRG